MSLSIIHLDFAEISAFKVPVIGGGDILPSYLNEERYRCRAKI